MPRQIPSALAAMSLAVACLATPSVARAQTVEDVGLPAIAAINFSPTTINIIAGAQTVTVAEHLTDDLSGVWYSCFGFRSPSWQQQHYTCATDPYQRESGTDLDGVYRTDVVFPQFGEAGEWHLFYADVTDRVGNRRYYSEQDLNDSGFATTLEVVAEADTVPPVIADFRISAAAIDVSASSQSVAVSERLTDDSSGVWYGCFGFRSPSWQQQHYACITDPYQRDSGTNLDGVFHTDVAFPQFAEAGEWRVFYADVTDRVGNRHYYSEQDLNDSGFTTTLLVAADPTDTRFPEIAALTLSAHTLNTSSGPQTVTVTERLTDDLSGVWYACFGFRSPSWQQQHYACVTSPYQRDAGTDLDGLFHADVVFPQYSEVGEWHVFYADVTDRVGNRHYYAEPDLDAAGFTTTLHVTENSAPVARAVAARTVACAAPGGTTATLDASASSDPDGDSLTFIWRERGVVIAGPAATPIAAVTLALGTHHIELTVDDGQGGSDTTTLDVEVVDTTPPALKVALSPDVLWPPNHRLAAVSAAVQATDACDAAPRIELVSITSNEPDDGLGDGDTAGDIQQASVGTDDRAFLLRVERSGKGSGRVYSVTYRATDASGNTTTATSTVSVTKSQK